MQNKKSDSGFFHSRFSPTWMVSPLLSTLAGLDASQGKWTVQGPVFPGPEGECMREGSYCNLCKCHWLFSKIS